MFEDYKRKINEAFGEYEAKMIKLSHSLMRQSISYRLLAYYLLDVRDECQEVADNIKEYVSFLNKEQAKAGKS